MAGGRRDGELEGQPSLQEMLPCGVAGKAKDSELRGRTVLTEGRTEMCVMKPLPKGSYTSVSNSLLTPKE